MIICKASGFLENIGCFYTAHHHKYPLKYLFYEHIKETSQLVQEYLDQREVTLVREGEGHTGMCPALEQVFFYFPNALPRGMVHQCLFLWAEI